MNFSRVEMIFLTTIQIMSLSFATYILFLFAQRTSPLRHFQNHVLMYLLIVAAWAIIIEMPHTQKYMWTGTVTIYTSWFCSLWNASFFSTSTLNRALMAFMCVERHFLVFHSQTHQTHRSRLLFHYIPLCVIVSTSLIYLFIINVLISCPQLNFDYSAFMCGYTCAVLIDNLGTIYVWLLVFLPTIVTIVGCILLPIRFIIQKRQLQRMQWQRARKMIIQTSMILSVYTICWLPYTIILQLLINNLLPFTDPNIDRYLTIAPYMSSLLTPFIVFHTIRRPMNRRIIGQIQRRLFSRQQGVVQPADNFVAQQINRRVTEEHHPI